GGRGGKGAADEIAPAALGLAPDGADTVAVEEVLRRLAQPAGLERVAQLDLNPTLPDISRSLTLLRAQLAAPAE
ncbi:MAG: hypothetical protein HYZ32_00420, partial [Hydrocarboniphaga effusa]|nr:hypothetical protein [Hydrocarboniphaga effusa]